MPPVSWIHMHTCTHTWMCLAHTHPAATRQYQHCILCTAPLRLAKKKIPFMAILQARRKSVQNTWLYKTAFLQSPTL